MPTPNRTKSLKIFPAAPINLYLKTVPDTRDVNALMGNDPQAAEEFTQPMSASRHFNRLAERYLYLRRSEFPLLEKDTWVCLLNAMNGRSEFALNELNFAMNAVYDEYGLAYQPFKKLQQAKLFERNQILADMEHPEPYQAVLSLDALTTTQQVITHEFCEYFWGQNDKSPEERQFSLRQSLSHFACRPAEVVFKDDDPLAAWDFSGELQTDSLGESKYTLMATNSMGLVLKINVRKQAEHLRMQTHYQTIPEQPLHWPGGLSDAKQEIQFKVLQMAQDAFAKQEEAAE